MLVEHALKYLLARGMPGLVNFLALAVYTRLLTAEEFGRYALLISGVGLVQVFAFQWLFVAITRFLPRASNANEVLQPVLAIFLVLAGVVALAGAIATTLSPAGLGWLLILATALAITQAWHELHLRIASARLEPDRFGRLSLARAVFAVVIGAALASIGGGASGLLLGLVVGCLLASFLFSNIRWRQVPLKLPSAIVLGEYRAYGVPLAVTFGLMWLASGADRLIIGWLIGEAAAGYYAVGYDLAQQSLGLLLAIVNTAAVPLAIRALEDGGKTVAREQMRQNGELIFAVAMGGAAGLIAIGPQIIELFVGQEFRAGARRVFPWIALVAGTAGLKAFYFDLAFHLARRSGWMIMTGLCAAVINIALNFLLIPRYGIDGAAWAALCGFSVASVLSALIGRGVFPMPNPFQLLTKGALVAVTTYLAADWGASWVIGVKGQLLGGLVLGLIAAVIVASIVNVANIRQVLLRSRVPVEKA